MPASRHARVSVAAPSSVPVTATSVADPPSAATLLATLAEPPMRCSSWSNVTTGTGASGEIRVTRPTMNLSSMASPTTSTCAPAKLRVICCARSSGTAAEAFRRRA